MTIIKNKGFALIEIIIGAAIIVTGILVVNQSYATYVKYAFANEKNTEASYLLSEGLEGMRQNPRGPDADLFRAGAENRASGSRSRCRHGPRQEPFRARHPLPPRDPRRRKNGGLFRPGRRPAEDGNAGFRSILTI